MIDCRAAVHAEPMLVTFRVNDPELEHRRVSVVGDFNAWDRTANLLWEQSAGVHSVTLALEPGRYRFRYVTADGRWFDDEQAHGYVQNPFGERDCVLEVGA